MFIDAWEARLSEAKIAKEATKVQLRDTEKQIASLLDRIVDAARPSVIGAYEERIKKLERQKIRLSEQAERIVPPQGRL